MKKAFTVTLIVIASLVLAVGIFFAGSMFARLRADGFNGMMAGYGWDTGRNSGYGPGMTLAPAPRPGASAGVGGQGGYGMGPGMMSGYANNPANLTPLTLDQAKAAAEKYLADLKNSDLKISEIMIFDNNAYVVVTEKSTGLGAFELLVDPGSRIAYPEHGPNMMWNLKYGGLNHQNMMGSRAGMMGGCGGMMGGSGIMGGNGWSSTIPSNVTPDMTVSPEKAIQVAQAYLDANLAGTTAATDPVQFYGYNTLDFEKNGVVAGMLSVNGYSGQVFLHTWHGTFIEEQAY
jgi:hypothetical protein